MIFKFLKKKKRKIRTELLIKCSKNDLEFNKFRISLRAIYPLFKITADA